MEFLASLYLVFEVFKSLAIFFILMLGIWWVVQGIRTEKAREKAFKDLRQGFHIYYDTSENSTLDLSKIAEETSKHLNEQLKKIEKS